MDKDLILNITNEAIKGKSPKRSILDIYGIKREGALEPLIIKYIRNEERDGDTVTFINQLTETIKDPSEIVTIVSDMMEIDYLRKRLVGMVNSYKKKGMILLFMLYIILPFITSTVNVLSGMRILPQLPFMEEYTFQNYTPVNIVIYSIFLETIATIHICRQFKLKTWKMLFIQISLFIIIFTMTGNWWINIPQPPKMPNI